MLVFPSFDKGPNDSAVLHKPLKGPNVEPKMNIILRFPAMGVPFHEENSPENDSLTTYNFCQTQSIWQSVTYTE